LAKAGKSQEKEKGKKKKTKKKEKGKEKGRELKFMNVSFSKLDTELDI
jgi:hypothetical protein